MVVAELVEQLLPTQEIRGLNPVIGNFIYYQLYLNDWKDENKEKEAGNGPTKTYLAAQVSNCLFTTTLNKILRIGTWYNFDDDLNTKQYQIGQASAYFTQKNEIYFQ